MDRQPNYECSFFELPLQPQSLAQPDLFEKAVEMERHMNEVRENLGRDAVYLHRALVPLDQAVGDQLPLFPEWDETCDEGVCFV